jgi:hypothetical protein
MLLLRDIAVVINATCSTAEAQVLVSRLTVHVELLIGT